MNIEIANITLIDGLWPSVRPFVDEAYQRCEAELAPGDLWQGCRSGNLFLVIGYDGNEILVSSIARFETGHAGMVLNILYLGGHGLNSWLPEIVGFFKQMAKENGAVGLVTQGRAGWGAVLDGVRKVRTVYAMEID